MASTPYLSNSMRHDASTSATRLDEDEGDSEQQVMKMGASSTVKSLLKQEILSEEEYIATLSSIIKRDFFPSLTTLDAQHDLLAAFESDDPARVEQSVRRMRELCTPTPRRRARGQTPGATPFSSSAHSETPTYFGATPDSRYVSTPAPRSTKRSQKPRIDPNISLDAFQSRYTSEDNSSFAVLLARDNAARKERYSWAWEAERKAKQAAIRGRSARERLVDVTQAMIETSADGTVKMLDGAAGRPGERKLIVGNDVKVGRSDRLMISASGTGVSGQLMITDGDQQRPRVSEDELRKRGSDVLAPQGLTGQERQFVDYDKATVEEEESNRAPTIDAIQQPMEVWNFKNRNSFMFPPDADSTGPSDPAITEMTFSKAKPKVGEAKGVRHEATRLKTLERAQVGVDDGTSDSSSPSRSRIGAAIAGTPYPANASRTPKVSGFSFVDALPAPQAASLPPQALQELMTWGTIEATPVTLRSSSEYDGSVGPFKIHDTSRRELLAHKMANQAKRSLSDRADTIHGGSASKSRRTRLALTTARGGILDCPAGAATPRNSGEGLSPAAASILNRTKQGRALDKGMTKTMTPRSTKIDEEMKLARAQAKARQIEVKDRMDRLKRRRWSESPAPPALAGDKAVGAEED